MGVGWSLKHTPSSLQVPRVTPCLEAIPQMHGVGDPRVQKASHPHSPPSPHWAPCHLSFCGDWVGRRAQGYPGGWGNPNRTLRLCGVTDSAGPGTRSPLQKTPEDPRRPRGFRLAPTLRASAAGTRPRTYGAPRPPLPACFLLLCTPANSRPSLVSTQPGRTSGTAWSH